MKQVGSLFLRKTYCIIIKILTTVGFLHFFLFHLRMLITRASMTSQNFFIKNIEIYKIYSILIDSFLFQGSKFQPPLAGLMMYNNDHFAQPPPAHMGIPPVHIDPKSGKFVVLCHCCDLE